MLKLATYRILFLVFLIGFFACQQKDALDLEPLELMEIPVGFPEFTWTEENEFTMERWQLGKDLFYDKMMSIDSSISCASCHQAQLAFSDQVALSTGAGNLIGRSNAPTLVNVAYHPYYTRAGGLSTLEMQILVPIQEHDEFNTNILDIVERMKTDPQYVAASILAYDREPDPYVITRSISVFERSLLSGNSPYDQYNYQGKNVLSKEEIAGMELFFSEKLACSQCHSGFNFTNYAFENNGTHLEYLETGRERITGEASDIGRFKVPTLRNIELTGPYMHDGSIDNLEAVIENYASGGLNHPNKSNLITGFSISKKEKENLIQFLQTLTDESFVENPIFQ